MTRRVAFGGGILLAIVLAAAGGSWMTLRLQGRAAAGPAGTAKAVRYHCPMHPTMVADRPGDCPICQMRMVPIEEDAQEGSEPAPAEPVPAGGKVLYRSTTNPNEVSNAPGKDSMGMDMVPVEVEGEAHPSTTAVPGQASVKLSTRKQQLIGVKTSVVARAPFRRAIRTVGRVTFDETRLHHVHTKVSGYVERLHANATGERVQQGQPLLELYSPELLASQQEYLVALRARERTAGSSIASVAASGDELVASSRRRLELFDLSESQIRELEASGRARRTVTLYAPMTGTIIKRNVTHGERVDPELALLDLADLSRVWVMASVFEYELPFVREGQRATMTVSYLSGESVEGRVALVYPVLDAPTRTVQVRLEFPNPGLRLKPDMYSAVVLEADLGERLAVPDTAVIESGTRSVVFVDQGNGLFEPREVATGLRLPDLYEILDGLAEGERVVTSGNFFVDSESRLKAALAATAEGPAPPAHRH